jgi:cell wall-associated NlpC family hydrolase
MMDTTPEHVVAAARAYLGVRWHHQGRSRAGLDCIGLIVRVAHDLGLSLADVHGYGRHPDGDRLLAGLRTHCVERSGAAPAPGMVALMRFDIDPQHLAIVVPYAVDSGLAIVHALAPARRVVEHRLDAAHLASIVALFDLPGVAR